MLAYRALGCDELKQSPDEHTNITCHMIKKMKKIISSHCAALDFDRDFLNEVLTERAFDLAAEVKAEKKTLSKNGKMKGQTQISLGQNKKSNCKK